MIHVESPTKVNVFCALNDFNDSRTYVRVGALLPINALLFVIATVLTILLILVVGLVINQEYLKERVKQLEGDWEE